MKLSMNIGLKEIGCEVRGVEWNGSAIWNGSYPPYMFCGVGLGGIGGEEALHAHLRIYGDSMAVYSTPGGVRGWLAAKL